MIPIITEKLIRLDSLYGCGLGRPIRNTSAPNPICGDDSQTRRHTNYTPYHHLASWSPQTFSAMSDPAAPHSASRLGEYTVIQDIAEGTFGKVKSKQITATFFDST
jgi:hypothetical protein